MTINELKQQAEQGNADAQLELASLYRNGQGVVQSYEKAVEWYTKAAEQGYAQAQNNLGVCYQYGQGVEQSNKKALRYSIKSALQGNIAACARIALIAEDNEDIEDLILKEIEYQKRKLDLDIITKEEYDKIKDLLKEYID